MSISKLQEAPTGKWDFGQHALEAKERLSEKLWQDTSTSAVLQTRIRLGLSKAICFRAQGKAGLQEGPLLGSLTEVFERWLGEERAAEAKSHGA